MPEILSAPRSTVGPARAARTVAKSPRRTAPLAVAAMGLLALGLLAMAPHAAAQGEPLMQFITPEMSFGQEAPGFESPPLREVTLTTPAVRIPSTCMLSACRDPTELPGAGVETPSLGAQPVDTPPFVVERTCVPGGVLCADGLSIPGQHLFETPDLEPQGHEVPSNRLPAFCESQSVVCLGPYELPSQMLLSTPGLEPRPLTPSAGASVSVPAVLVWLPQYQPETGSVEPTPLTVDLPLFGPLGIVLCEQGCPSPHGPDLPMRWSDDVRAVLWIEDRSFAPSLSNPFGPSTA